MVVVCIWLVVVVCIWYIASIITWLEVPHRNETAALPSIQNNGDIIFKRSLQQVLCIVSIAKCSGHVRLLCTLFASQARKIKISEDGWSFFSNPRQWPHLLRLYGLYVIRVAPRTLLNSASHNLNGCSLHTRRQGKSSSFLGVAHSSII